MMHSTRVLGTSSLPLSPHPVANHLAPRRPAPLQPRRALALSVPLLVSHDGPGIVEAPASEKEVGGANESRHPANPTPIELTPINFESSVTGDNLVLVDFYTDYCGPCKLMHTHFEMLQSIFKKIKFVKYNCGIEGHEALATRQRIRSLPTFRLYHCGKFLEEVTGARPVQLRQMLVHYHR